MSKVSLKNNNNIFITGFMGSGKTTVGEILARKLNRKFLDLDDAVENFLNNSIPSIIKKFGIEYFRKIENQQLALLCKNTDTVIALGGGSLIAHRNQKQVIKSGILIYLMTEEKTLINRLENSQRRPLLKTKSFKELFEERKEGFLKADMCIKTDDASPEKVVSEILQGLEFYESHD